MKSEESPVYRIGKTSREVTVHWQPSYGNTTHTTHIPSGTEVKDYGTPGNPCWYVDHPGRFVKDRGGLELHDAIHHGIPIEDAIVTQAQEVNLESGQEQEEGEESSRGVSR